MFNVFEAVLTPHQQREIETIKTALLQAGALGATMSGSGPTVLGLFDREDLAREAVQTLKEDYTDVYLTQPV
jgi:4-diphosphocytidyl-2-C-methyl-D-erythritol kinase